MSQLMILLFPMMIWVLFLSSAQPCHHRHHHHHLQAKFEQKTERFWEFEEESNTWVQVKLPYDLVACVNDTCTKVGSIGKAGVAERRRRRRVMSLTKMSESSIWVSGESGAIYERFWNGVQWVIAPHHTPQRAISVFIVNHTILALSHPGNLYQMQLSENSQPFWTPFIPITFDQSVVKGDESSQFSIKSGVVSHDRRRVYFCTKNGTLLELSEADPPRWLNHGQPPGADAAAVADPGSIRTEVVYTISSAGDLYEYDRSSKPSWKKHVRQERALKDSSLQPLTGTASHGLNGDSASLFLLTKGGNLVERRLQQRKWKWIIHGSPAEHQLTSITQAQQDDAEGFVALFLTTDSGSVFEYRILKKSDSSRENPGDEAWISHSHPPNTKAARGIAGLPFQLGRMLFALDDGRLAELHLSGIGGENSGTNHQTVSRRKTATKFVWSVLGAPESEGWNSEYCNEERGPLNCIAGTKHESGTTGSTMRRTKGSQRHEYLIPAGEFAAGFSDQPLDWSKFRLRAMQVGKSFFLVTEDGFVFEYLYTEMSWIWLRHEHSAAIRGAVGNYNGSLFVIDSRGSLLIRERSETELTWIDCGSPGKGEEVVGGPPWEGMHGRAVKFTAEDSLFFVSRKGRLLQFIELFRDNIVFVVGANGRLYQYNKVSELWHEHYQSRHLVLSRSPGTATRASKTSLTGSVFMLSESGGLVEYHWNAVDGWNWVEHGAPHKGVVLVGSPGPAFEGNQLFLVGSDGNVYLRFMDRATWQWRNCGFPSKRNEGLCVDEDYSANLYCDSKVAPVRPIAFAEDSAIFELRDNRLGELKRIEGNEWAWSRTIGTPTSLCMENYWTALAS